jgi:sugar phosphate isomerase/epimerase
MRLGFYTYSYTDKLRMPVVPCLERIARTGYSGIDVSGTDGPSADPRSVSAALRKLTRETAERLGLRIEAVITHAQLTDSMSTARRGAIPLDLAGTVDLAVDLGADVVTFHMGGYPEAAARDPFWRATMVVLRKAADYAAARHVQIAVDGIWPTWLVDSPETLDRMFHDVGAPNLGVNFDPSYLVLMGVDPVGFAKRFPSRIVHAHLKDHVGKLPRWTHLVVGRGEMNYAQVFAALERTRFGGSCAVECFTDMKFETACDDGFRAMTDAAAKAGVRFRTSP